MSQDDGLSPRAEETISLPLKIENQGIVYQDKYRKIEKIRAVFDSFIKDFFVSDFGEKAAVIVVKNDSVLFVKQYRLLVNSISYEIPGGSVNAKEKPEDAAVRECLEETGFKCVNLRALLNFNLDLEYTKNYTHIFYSDDVENMPGSDGRYAWIPIRDCMNMIFAEKISDCLSIISIFAYWTKVNRQGFFSHINQVSDA